MSTPSSSHALKDSPRLSREPPPGGGASSQQSLSEDMQSSMASKAEDGAKSTGDKREDGNQSFAEADRPAEKAAATSSQPSSSSLGRSGTLSWQQRPSSRGSTGVKSRPLSVVATENSRMKSPRGTPDPETSPDADMSRSQITQSLGSKDPSCFKQTQDRGLGSVAFRKSQETSKSESWTAHGNLRLPGMSRESTAEPEKEPSPRPESIPPSQSREGSMRGSSSWSQRYVSTAGSSVAGSIAPTLSSQKFEPPGSSATRPASTDEGFAHEHTLHVSHSGRTSPARFDRPASPTKGLGGFVQSAMLKRSDSQNKRWSAQAGGLSRGNSVISNKSGYDGSKTMKRGTSPPRDQSRSALTRESSPDTTARPISSHDHTQSFASNAGEKLLTSASARGRLTRDSDGFIKPELPDNSRPSLKDAETATLPPLDISKTSPTPSSSKVTETKRWSPQKASWLESALNKPDSPKPAISNPTQPSWMIDLGKAKSQRSSGDQNKTSSFKEVTTGGLLRSPPMGAGFKKPNISDVAIRPSQTTESVASNLRTLNHTTSLPNVTKSEDSLPEEAKVGRPVEDDGGLMEELRPTKSEASRPTGTVPTKPTKPTALENKLNPPTKSKPITPPKKDFRAGLKPHQDPAVARDNEEAEFKNVFGKLKRTETKNYKAPDELKDNILRGKAGLAITGGPKKTERRDEFKESILKKKEEMKTGPTIAAIRKTSAPEHPEKSEALARMLSLSKAQSKPDEMSSEAKEVPKSKEALDNKRNEPSSSDTSLPQQMPSKVSSTTQAEPKLNGKLAGRFNPALAGLLSRGPPPLSGDGRSKATSPVRSDSRNTATSIATTTDGNTPSSSRQLTHMTKSRARGPKRKAPKAVKQSDSGPTNDLKPPTIGGKAPVSLPDTVTSAKSPFENFAPLRTQDMSKPLSNVADNSKNQSPSTTAIKPGVTAPKPAFSSQTNPSTPLTQHQSQNATKLLPDLQVKKAASPKSPDVRKPSSQVVNLSTPSFDTKPKDTINKSPLKTVELDTAINSKFQYQEKVSPAAASPINESPKFSVSDAAARWSSSADMKLQQSQPPKSPIKLPRRSDEDAAHKDTGLYDRQMKEPVGLGIRPLPKPPTKPVTIQDNLGLPTTTIRKVSPPTPTKKLNLTAQKASSNGTSTPPQSTRSQSRPSTSETAGILSKYFGELPPATTPIDIDTPKILESRHQPDANKIKTLRKQIWQVTSDGRKTSLAPQQEHILYEDSMYLCTHVFGSTSGTRTTEVYLWYGDEVSSAAVEDTQLFSRKVAKENGSKLVLLRQGKETSEFFQALGGIVITRKNRSGSYVLCGRRHMSHIAFDEVPFSSASLCSGFPYIVSAGSGKLYLWKGVGAGVDELGCARLIGMDLEPSGEIEEVDEGKESRAFWDVFPEKKAASTLAQSGDWKTKPSLEKYATRLFSVGIEAKTTSSGIGGFAMWGRRSSTPGPVAESSIANVREIHPYTQADLEADAVFVLDTFFEILMLVTAVISYPYCLFISLLLSNQIPLLHLILSRLELTHSTVFFHRSCQSRNPLPRFRTSALHFSLRKSMAFSPSRRMIAPPSLKALSSLQVLQTL